MQVVTGGAGFIGYALSCALVDSHQEVVVIDNFDSTLYSAELKRHRADQLRMRGVKVLEGNDLTCLDESIQVSTVFNLAATAGLSPSWSQIDAYTLNNFASLGRSLQWLVQNESTARVIHASTSSVYGETATGDVSSDLKPVSPYGVSKLAAEHLLRTFGEIHGTNFNILRLFSVYGPRQRPDQLFSIVLRRLAEGSTITVFGDGKNSRANLFVDDAVGAFIAAQHNFHNGAVYDISGAETISAMEVISRLSELLDIEAMIEFLPARAGDQTSTTGDLAATLAGIGWRPTTSFAEGTEKLVDHFLANPEEYKGW